MDKMKKITGLSEYLEITKSYPKSVFYRGENRDNGEIACVAKALRNENSYDRYFDRLDAFDRKVRESALLDNPSLLIPFAQHSGLATKLLDISSSPLVALYFACQQPDNDSEGYVYIFDDYADATSLMEEYPKFDLEEELLQHLNLLDEQKRLVFSQPENDFIAQNQELTGPKLIEELGKHQEEFEAKLKGQILGSVEHRELELFGKCIENYRNKYLQGGYSKRSRIRGVDKNNSPFRKKWDELRSLIEGIKKWIVDTTSSNEAMSYMLPDNYNENTPAIDYVHPYREKRYGYYNEQYKSFNIEVKEYLISLECLVAFINDRSPVGSLAPLAQLPDLTMDFLPNFLYQPILTFKRGLSQQSAFFVQTIFDKHYLHIYNNIDDLAQSNENYTEASPRQLLKCQANYSQKIEIDGNSKKAILEELDKIGINKATMFGDADNIASYITETINKDNED